MEGEDMKENYHNVLLLAIEARTGASRIATSIARTALGK